MTLSGYVFRRIFRSPGFSAMVVVTIALGIGFNLGIFCVTKAIFLSSLGVPEADRLVYYTLGSGADASPYFSSSAYGALRTNAAMNDVLAWASDNFRLQMSDGSIVLPGALVTGNTFSVLGLKPRLGRFFGESEDAPGGGKKGWTAVLGYSYWKAHFGANPDVIGKDIAVNGVPVLIVGVLPQEFTGIQPFGVMDILLPSHFESVGSHPGEISANVNYSEWLVFGRLARGTSIQAVRANLKVIESPFRKAADLASTSASLMFPNTAPGSWLGVHDGRLGIIVEFHVLSNPLLALEGLAGAVLLFCCCNLILLFIGRARREAHQTAIRMALGARLGDHARFAMLEATALAAMGCIIAVPVAWSTARILSDAIQSLRGFNAFPTIAPSNSLLLTAVGTTLAIACLTGGGTSLWQRRKCVSIHLNERGGATAARSRSWIIGFEVFACILLITAAVVSGIGFQTISHSSGFGDGNAVMSELNLQGDILGPQSTLEQDRILNRIESFPGVQAVAMTNCLPLSGGSVDSTAEVYGTGGAVRQLHVWPLLVSARYFPAIGTRIVKGRAFTEDDLASGPVCVLSSGAASELFFNEDPLGKYVYGSGRACRVVGVAEDAHFKAMFAPADAILYQLSRRGQRSIVVRAASSDLAIQAVHNAAQAVAPDTLAFPDTIQAHVDRDLRVPRIMTLSGTLCALLAGMILGVGFFGVLSLQVAERRREIGIRITLGANRVHVCVALAKTLRRAVVIGLGLGSGGALLAAIGLEEVYRLSAPVMIGGYLGSLVLLGFLLLATAAVPVSRAFAVSPMEVLSSE